jgi:hypothetical protein
MKKGVCNILNMLGNALIKKDFDSIESICAPWLQGAPLKKFIKLLEMKEAEVRNILSDADIGHADSFEIDDNDCTIQELRDDGVDLPKEIDDSVFIDFKIIFGPLLLKGFILDNVCVKL